MTELRWILGLLGVVILVGIYLWGRRPSSAAGEDAPAPPRQTPKIGDLGAKPKVTSPPRTAPTLTEPPPEPEPPPVRAAEPSASEAQPAPEPPVADKIIKLHLVGKEGETFNAADLVAALRAEGLRFGHFDLFHRFAGEGNPTPDSQPLFSVSDMLKPGTFDLETLAEKEMRGISLFMLLPNPGDPVAVFADMLATGRRLAATLAGQLVDSQGCSVSRQSASHMREDIINYHHGLQSALALEEDRVD